MMVRDTVLSEEQERKLLDRILNEEDYERGDESVCVCGCGRCVWGLWELCGWVGGAVLSDNNISFYAQLKLYVHCDCPSFSYNNFRVLNF